MYSLEDEFLNLRQRRVALRQGVERMGLLMAMRSGDFYSNRETLVYLERELRATERRYCELRALTGRRPVAPPVNLKLPSATVAQPVKYAPTRRQAAGPYVHRMITTR